MIRRPPSSPLFPYTTLSRPHRRRSRRTRRRTALSRVHRGLRRRRSRPPHSGAAPANPRVPTRLGPGLQRRSRSEEHTSELQSPDHLVCRLLLEKKKKTISQISTPKNEQSMSQRLFVRFIKTLTTTPTSL